MPSAIETANQTYKDALAKGEKAALKRIARAHEISVKSLQAQLAKVVSVMEKDAALGLDSGAYILQQQRLTAMLAEAQSKFMDFGTKAGIAVQQAQLDGVVAAESYVTKAVQAQMGPPPNGITAVDFGKLHDTAITEMVGNLGDGSPLRDLTQTFGDDASKSLNSLLIEGITTGLNPVAIARKMHAAVLDIGRRRAETIARTEMMRAARQATSVMLQENDDVIKGWTWLCAQDRRTCPVCWAMQGKEFKTDVLMATHPNCRCTMTPLAYTWRELGFDLDEPQFSPKLGPGETLFKQLPQEDQRFILGKGGYTAYSNGLVSLDDFVQDTYSPLWGYGRSRKSLRKMVGPRAAESLTAGKIPGKVLVPGKIDMPSIGDPFKGAKTHIDDLVNSGKLHQSEADDLLQVIADGKATSNAEALKMVRGLQKQKYDVSLSKIDEAKQLGAITDSEYDELLKDLQNGMKAVDQDALNSAADVWIQDQKGILQSQFDMAKDAAIQELDKAKLYGNISDANYDYLIDQMNTGSLTKSDLGDIYANYQSKNTVNNPYAKLHKALDDAHDVGAIDDATYSSMKDHIAKGGVPSNKIDYFDDYFQGLYKSTAKVTDPLTQTPDAWAKLTKLNNEFKLSPKDFDDIAKDVQNGKYTIQELNEYADTLEQKLASKVMKSSQQLKDELNATYLPHVEKQNIIQKYNQKIINKEQMQDEIDKASLWLPPKPVPNPIGPAWSHAYDAFQDVKKAYHNGTIDGQTYKKLQQKYYNIGKTKYNKLVTQEDFYDVAEQALGLKKPVTVPNTGLPLPFKKHISSLQDMVKQGIIDQSQMDDVLAKYGTGQWKNKNVESWIKQQGGSVPTKPSPWNGVINDKLPVADPEHLEHFNWNSQEWRSTDGPAQLRKIRRSIDSQVTQAINAYTDGSYSGMNKVLRHGHTGGHYEDLVKQAEQIFDHPDAIVPRDVVAKRGAVIRNHYQWANAQPGQVISDDGIMSTTTNDHISFSHKTSDPDRVGLEIYMYVPQGSNAVYVAPISDYKSESELLFRPGQQWYVEKVTEYIPHGYSRPTKKLFLRFIPGTNGKRTP